MPSPTSGSRPALMMPIFTGQPERKAAALHFALSQAKPPFAHEGASVEQPLALIAYTRELPKLSRLPSTPSEAVVVWEALISPSLPWPEMYSSLLPTMMLGGLLGPSSWATAAVSTILPWSSFLSWLAGTLELNVTWWLCGSIEATFSGSSTSTGKPLTAVPSACHAYTWRSSPAATMSTPLADGSSLASTGEVTKPPSVRWRVPKRSCSHEGLPASGAPEKSGLAFSWKTRLPAESHA